MPRVDRRMLVVLSAAALYSLVVIVPAAIEILDRWSHGSTYSQDALAGSVPLGQSEVTIASERLAQRMQQEPELSSRLEKLIADVPEPKDPQPVREAAQQFGARLSRAGMKRLDDESLLAMGAGQRKLLMQADLAGCAALTRGNPGSGLFQMLENLGREDVGRFFDLTYQAMVAERSRRRRRGVRTMCEYGRI